MTFSESKRKIPVEQYQFLKKYADFDVNLIDVKYRKFHLDCVDYYNEGFVSAKIIDKWSKVIKTTEHRLDKKRRDIGKRI